MMADVWTRAFRCEAGACIEVKYRRGANGDVLVVRDSKLGDASLQLCYSLPVWDRLVERIKAGKVDSPMVFEPLEFDDDEWAAFAGGVRGGEFDLLQLRPKLAGSSRG